MSEVLHRKCIKVEWAEANAAAAVAGGSPSGTAGAAVSSSLKHHLVNNVVSASFGAVEKRAYLVGGVSPKTGKSLAQSLEYDMTTKTWSSLGAWFPAPISDAPMVSCGATLVIFGGWDDEHILGDLWIVTNKVEDSGVVTPGQWKRVVAAGAATPSPRRGHSMVASLAREDGSFTVYVFGGFDGQRRLNDLWSLDVSFHADSGVPVASGTWAQLPMAGETPNARDACAFALDHAKQRLTVFGGYTVAVDQGFYTYDLPIAGKTADGAAAISPSSTSTTPADNTSSGTAADINSGVANPGIFQWTKRTFPVIPSRRQHTFGVCSHNYFLTLFGHDGKQTLSQVCQLHTVDNKWSLTAFDGDEIEPRLTPSICLAEGGKKVLVFGGQGPKGKYLTSLLELELEKCEVAAPVKGKGK